jgi:hypothetical protein
MPPAKSKKKPAETPPTPVVPRISETELARLAKMPKTRALVRFTVHQGPDLFLVRVPAWQPQSLAIVDAQDVPENLRATAEAQGYLSALVNLDAQDYPEVIFSDWEACDQTPIPIAPEARDKEATICEVK